MDAISKLQIWIRKFKQQNLSYYVCWKFHTNLKQQQFYWKGSFWRRKKPPIQTLVHRMLPGPGQELLQVHQVDQVHQEVPCLEVNNLGCWEEWNLSRSMNSRARLASTSRSTTPTRRWWTWCQVKKGISLNCEQYQKLESISTEIDRELPWTLSASCSFIVTSEVLKNFVYMFPLNRWMAYFRCFVDIN